MRKRKSILFFLLLLSLVFLMPGKVSAKVRLNRTKITLCEGKSCQLKVKGTKKKAVYSSTNTSVARVSASGKITAVKKGKAVIKVKVKGKKKTYSCKVTVKETNCKRFLKSLDKMSKQAAADKAAGKKWYYSPSGVKDTFALARSSNARKTTCIYYVNWALKDIGVLHAKGCAGGQPNGRLWYRNAKSKKEIKKYCNIINVNATAAALYKAGKLKKGDICIWNLGSEISHTNVFYGYDKNTGEYLWYDAGRTEIEECWQGTRYYFNDFGPVDSMDPDGYHITHILRLK